MPDLLIECIPNFSEARRPEVVEAILSSIVAVPGVCVLDRHSDLDHNRTVITYIGHPSAVAEAAFRSISKASQLIDLNQHTGQHPRIGATDVVPFVPISGVTMQECIELARNLGQRVANELNIPVYLYEEAATRPDRQNLENIRRGEYETLKEEIGTNPTRTPDFGPSQLGPAGATVIGARQPLIAYNIYLSTDDVTIADQIARAVRNSSGGLRFVKAMGVLVEGRAQVSMNLTNYRQTPIARVVEMVRREATRYGVSIHHSELVGLIPQEALFQAATWYLQLDGFELAQVLELRLADSLKSLTEEKIPIEAHRFLDELARGNPTPGGGSASAYAGAMAAGLVAMVARLTIGKKKYANVENQMWPIIDQAEVLRTELTEAVQKDAEAFDAILAANRLPKITAEQQTARLQAIEQATIHAAEVPLHVARNAVSIMELALRVSRIGNLNAISDVGTAAMLAIAAIKGAGLNIRTNLKSLQDPSPHESIFLELNKLEEYAAKMENSMGQILKERSGLSLPL